MELEHNAESGRSSRLPLEHQPHTLVKILIEVEAVDAEASRFNHQQRPVFQFGLPTLQQHAVLAPVKSRSSHSFAVYIPRLYPYEAPKVFIDSLMSLSFIKAQSPQNMTPIDSETGLVKLGILGADWTPILSLDMIIFELENMLKNPESHQTYSRGQK